MTRFYNMFVLAQPKVTLVIMAALVGFFALHAPKFRLDATSDSLVLENDAALAYYRSISARYGSDDYLIITYSPLSHLFDPDVLEDLGSMRDKLAAMERVAGVTTILDVPLIESPPITFDDLEDGLPTLGDPETDRTLAEKELTSSPLYRNLLISEDATTTAVQVVFERDDKWTELRERRDGLREILLERDLTKEESEQLKTATAEFNAHVAEQMEREHEDIAQVRSILDQHRDTAVLHLGGVPMIAADSIEFVRNDLVVFGLAVFGFLVVLLFAAFRRVRWVVLTLVTCSATGLTMIGFLGWQGWTVTVVSSNFLSLLLIITLSLTVHLIVRFRELHALSPDADRRSLVLETVRTKAKPSFYAVVTTIVAFGSLVVSGIRPVIDFGQMVSIGLAFALLYSLVLFPASIMLFEPGTPGRRYDLASQVTRVIAWLVEKMGSLILLAFAALMVAGVIGITFLTVENRFIDYYKKTTEIYQGMELIDLKMGGTTPLDIIIDAPPEFFEPEEIVEDEFDDEFDFLDEDEGVGITGTSYWFNNAKLPEVARIHDYIDSLPETGKVLSITSTMRLFEKIDAEAVKDDFLLSIAYQQVPDEIRDLLISPYLSEDGNQIRISVRVFESDKSLKRQKLLGEIKSTLVSDFGLEPEQIHLTGVMVLYNNMLQSLFASQIATIGMVFALIFFMFVALFRNVWMAAIALAPNMVAGAMVLGLMGWFGIPLDIMTITIAAISVGIGVDNAIHYIHRFEAEFEKDRDYWPTVRRSHASIGRAMYYTSVTIALGFSILALSNFIPTIYFGLLTAFSMGVAMIANLTLLPILIVKLKPLGK